MRSYFQQDLQRTDPNGQLYGQTPIITNSLQISNVSYYLYINN